MEIVG